MFHDTYKTAKNIVDFFQCKLQFKNSEDLPSIRSIFITGSFIRGDWLNMSSDLDINFLFLKDCDKEQANKDFDFLTNMVATEFVNPPFSSQAMSAPFGLDLSKHYYIPVKQNDIKEICPYLYFSVFYFDFLTNCRIIWGENFIPLLPCELPAKELVKPAIDFLLNRMITYDSNSENYKLKCAYAAYKATAMLQIHFGEKTLNKRKLLELYMLNVPDFNYKTFGEFIIRNYLGNYYPNNTPKFLEAEKYIDYVKSLKELLDKY
jgi:hypothetical protein